ncbi:hypothetical protein Ocin01_01908 [Orchesella cincta]|uniref:Uncharacterized protein n=1 Tax=Orchesella cincta TaxID=48709 RepID=A0A1D2NI82_ORCCI|nr:hypothetical protein Ocin01_01908 [Orchesella cincta]
MQCYTLLTEVRELIRPVDVHQFDELIYNKSTSFRVSASSTITTTSCTITNPLLPNPMYQNNNNELISSPPPPPPPPNQMLMQQPNTGALSLSRAPPPPATSQHNAPPHAGSGSRQNPNLSVGNMNEMVLSTDCNGPFPPPQWRNNALPLQQNTGNVPPPPPGPDRSVHVACPPAVDNARPCGAADVPPAGAERAQPSTNTQALQPARTSTTPATTILQTTKEVATIQNCSTRPVIHSPRGQVQSEDQQGETNPGNRDRRRKQHPAQAAQDHRRERKSQTILKKM